MTDTTTTASVQPKKGHDLWARALSEFAGSLLICFAIYLMCTFGSAFYNVNLAFVTVCVGVIYAAMTAIFARISGAQFNPAVTVAAMLILYGVLFLVVENRRIAPHVMRLDQITYRDALLIGVWQCLAIIPGTSRSGATIVGGLLLGLSRACVAEFTFFLAIPIMFGWGIVKVAKFLVAGLVMSQTEIAVLVAGVLCSFVVSVISIKFLMGYIKKNDFTAFGWYRIVVGIIVLSYFGAKGMGLF